jgi:hypothetical protein
MDEHLNQLLTKHKSELEKIHSTWLTRPEYRMGFNICEFPWLQGYIVKYGIERVANADKLRKIISEFNLDQLDVPEKYIFRLYDDGKDISNTNAIVIAKYISGAIGKGSFQLNLNQTKQLCTLAMKTPHYDIHRMNIILFCEKIYIIDTFGNICFHFLYCRATQKSEKYTPNASTIIPCNLRLQRIT